MKYKHVVLPRVGEPDVLEIHEEELPEPGAHEVRVKILAAGVAFADVMMRRGKYPFAPRMPFTPGYDIVGIIETCGPAVHGPVPGQLIAALTHFGGYSQYLCLSAREVVPVPVGCEPVEAVCLVLNYLTAYQMLHRLARVQAGERILVHGAAGGVGTALLQLGRLAHLELYGTASAAKHALVTSLGAQPIDYQREDFRARLLALTGTGVDVVFDPVGGAAHIRRSFASLRRGGRLVVYGLSASMAEGRSLADTALPQLFWLALWSLLPNGRRVSIYSGPGPLGVQDRHPDWVRADLTRLLALLAAREIQPIIAQRFPLNEVARAHELIEQAGVAGKIVLLPQD